MNLKTLFCGIAAAAMFTACSSDEPAVGPNGPDNGQFNGSGFMNVSINMPTDNGSRAENDKFDHGSENEYKVKNAMLILFTGATEDAAVFHSAYDLQDMNKANNADGADGANITKTYTKTIQVNNVSDGAVLWGLVLVNYDQVATKGLDGNAGFIKTLTFNGQTVTTQTTFTAMNEAITAQSFIGDGTTDFFMANAPINTNPGGVGVPGDNVTTLVKLGTPAQCIRPTAAEAEAQPAGSFYVERAVAKATLTYANNLVGTLKDNNLAIESVEWILDNVEPESYVIRNMGNKNYIDYVAENTSSPNPHRFVGHSAIGMTSLQPTKPLYRTYWCIDPTYNTDKTQNWATTNNLAFKDAGHDKPQYCHENTFDVAHQNYWNTTRAILKVKFTSSATDKDANGNLYVVANDPSKIYDNEAKAKSNMISAILDQVKVDFGKADVFNDNAKFEITTDTYADYLEVTWAAMDENNVVKLASVKYKENAAYKTKPADFDKATIENLNAYFRYSVYTAGVAYYDVRFKHFGDDLTPWQAPASTVNTTDEAYGVATDAEKAAKNYLGRYGMVRNNWYELNITSFKNLGVPVVNNLNVDKSDDNNEAEKWISFKINILAWALRTQNVEL